jgi:hypothetical protein
MQRDALRRRVEIERGLVVLIKQPRPGRQGWSLMVWDHRFHEAWQKFVSHPAAWRHIPAQQEAEERRANARPSCQI